LTGGKDMKIKIMTKIYHILQEIDLKAKLGKISMSQRPRSLDMKGGKNIIVGT